MNQIQELEAQNLQDSWSLLYLSLARTVLNQTGSGEDILRKIVRRYGSLIGAAEREAHRTAGIKTNLENFYLRPVFRFYDPRLYCNIQRLNEQTALLDILRCPFANCVRQNGGEAEGKVFCEEFLPSCLEAYTGKTAQVNLSEILTEPQNTHCRLASYFRPANLKEDRFEDCFTTFKEQRKPDGENQVFAGRIPADSSPELIFSKQQNAWGFMASGLIDAFLGEEKLGAEIMQIGLEHASVQIAAFLKKRAASMEQTLDRTFLMHNCPAAGYHFHFGCCDTSLLELMTQNLGLKGGCESCIQKNS